MYFIYNYLIFSMIGWLWETPFVSIRNKRYINRGFLKGPYIPIYGTVVSLSFIVLKEIESLQYTPFLSFVLQFLVIALSSAVFEYVTSYLLEYLFKERWWDYSYKRFNLHGRVALDYMFLFGLGGVILYTFIEPLTLSIFKTTPYMNYFISVLSIIMFIDFALTIVRLLKVRDYLVSFRQVIQNIDFNDSKYVKEFNLKLKEFKIDFNEIHKNLEHLKEKYNHIIFEKLGSDKRIKTINNLYRKFPKYNNISRHINIKK